MFGLERYGLADMVRREGRGTVRTVSVRKGRLLFVYLHLRKDVSTEKGGERFMARKVKALAKKEETGTDLMIAGRQIRNSVVLKALKSIEARNGGTLTPYDVVDEARDPGSPIHRLFLWDDAEAGERYRLAQARIIINSVRVEFLGEQREAYLNVRTKVENVTSRAYVPIEKVMSDTEMHQQVLNDAVNEIEYWQRKYEQLSELKEVINSEKLARVKRKVRR